MFSEHKHRFLCLYILLTAVTLFTIPDISRGESSDAYSFLTIAYGQDSNDGSNAYLVADFSSATGPRALLVSGRSKSVSSNTTITTSTFIAGLYNNPGSRFEFGLDYRYWGNESEINTDTYRLTLGWRADDFSIRILPQYRPITLYTTGLFAIRRRPTIEIDSTGLGLEFDYYGLAPLYISLSYLKNEYDGDVSRLATEKFVRFIFSPDTLDLASGFEKDRVSVDAGLDFKIFSPGLEWLRSRSAVDGAEVIVKSVYLITRLSRSWTLDLRLGIQELSVTADKLKIASAGLSYYW
ncbi:MAG: hypothetical protein BMS9Abin33_0675 [Gammaproteobacteria bacterium]|nr:MAG: hypothetical protein BMS9Abin33_0675 [Gammaproteobacteria bacterium]